MDDSFFGAMIGSALGTFTGWFAGAVLVAVLNARNLRKASQALQATVISNTDRLRATVAAGLVAQAVPSRTTLPNEAN